MSREEQIEAAMRVRIDFEVLVGGRWHSASACLSRDGAERIVDALAQPVEVTDEMVERAAEVWNNEGAAGSLGTRWAQLIEYERECWRPVARAALRAALEAGP